MVKIPNTVSIESKKRGRLIDPLNGNLFKTILAFAIPVMLTGLLQLAFNAADMIIVGRFVGSAAVGQVGATGALINLLVNLFIGFSVGVSVGVSKEYGAKNSEKISKYIHTSIAVAIVAGILCFIVGLSLSRQLLVLMGTPESHLDGSTLYMSIYFIAMPATIIYNFGSAALRALGDSKTPLLILSSAGVINVIFNFIFVCFFNMSVDGVATATVISQYIAMVWILIHLSRSEGPQRLCLRKIRFDSECTKSIIAVGLPAGISGTLFSLSNVVAQSSINIFGGTVINGNAAASNIEGFIYTTSNAFHQAAITFIGQNRGAGKYDRILKALGVCLVYSLGFEIVLGLITYIFKEQLLGIYIKDSQASIMLGAMRMTILSLSHFLCGTMDVINGSLRGLGVSLSPTLISLTTVCGFRILWLSTVFDRYRTIPMIYIMYPVSWALSVVALASLFFAIYSSQLKKHKARLAEASTLSEKSLQEITSEGR